MTNAVALNSRSVAVCALRPKRPTCPSGATLRRPVRPRGGDPRLVAPRAGAGFLLPFAAARGVEQRAQSRLRCELRGEDDAATVEEPALVSFEARQRPAEAVAAGFPQQTPRGELP